MREGALPHLKAKPRERRFAVMESVRPGGVKNRRSLQREALFRFFLQHVDPYAFYYDRERDETVVYRTSEEDEVEEVVEKGFFGHIGLEKHKLNAAAAKDPIAGAFYEAIAEPQAATFFFEQSVADGEEDSWRVDYMSVAEDDGRVAGICGMVSAAFPADADEDAEEVTYSQNPQTKLYESDAFSSLAVQRLSELRTSEKGVLFVVSIDAFREIIEELGQAAYDSYLSMISQVLHADVRVMDILGRLDDQSVGIFITGCISIDIVEKRAQHILDLFLRVQPKDFHPITFSMGIAIRGASGTANHLSFEKMEAQAKEAMMSARNFGPNRYRMYDDL
ncbi:diguanylate cyclase [Selenomonas sp. TAMA-11512]|uniref:GGDEF domain-containing protein n=1 Tax=Selenomonas sp. TAMA-11512 TaxID=3095337 RepID=UPI0030CFC541